MLREDPGEFLGAANFRPLELIEPGKQGIKRAIVLDEAARSLFANPGNTLDIVNLFAHQGHYVDQHARFAAEAIAHFAQARAFTIHRAPQRDTRRDELHEILVARDNHGVEAVARTTCGERADNVIGLVAIDYQTRDTEQVDRAKDIRNLLQQVVRRFHTIGLVGFEQIVAEIL